METHDKKGKRTSYVLILVFVILTVSIVIAGYFYHRNYEVHYRVELVVVRGFGQKPMMVLTNLPVKRSRKSVWHVAAAYLSRWWIEETIRFLKQSYQLEDIRLLTYVRLQNMMALVMAVAYFTSVYLGLKLKLRVLARHVFKAAQRVFGIPDFRLYALADGIKHFLFNRSKGLRIALPPPKPRFVQRLLFDP